MPYLSPRQQELVYFVHTYFKPEVDGYEFMDMNMSLKRLVDWIASKPDFVRNPWKRHIPTLTGSCNILMRKTKGGQVEQLRALEGVELMALIGWHPSFWCSLADEAFLSHELLTSLSGNALSAFAAGPMIVA